MKEIKLPLQDRNIVITRAKGQISEAKKIFKNAGAFIFDLPASVSYTHLTLPTKNEV